MFLAAVVFGGLSGLSGAFLLVSRRCLLGDVLAHSALPGMVLAWLLIKGSEPGFLVLGALFSLCLAWLTVSFLSNQRQLNSDAAMSCTLAVFFGVGLMLLSVGAKLPGFGEAGLESAFLGSLATVLESEIVLGGACLLFFIGFISLNWSSLWKSLFDPEAARLQGIPVLFIKVSLSICLLVSLAASMRTLGILLLLSLCVTPALLARHCASRLSSLCAISGVLGAVFCAIGGAWSALPQAPPPGPATVIVASSIFLVVRIFQTLLQRKPLTEETCLRNGAYASRV